jgi:hypothetical protein
VPLQQCPQWHQPQNPPQRSFTPQYNSSNALHSYNNIVVDMDVGWGQSNRNPRGAPQRQGEGQYCWGGNPAYTRAAPAFPDQRRCPRRPFNDRKCYRCREEGHFKRLCPQNRLPVTGNIIDMDEGAQGGGMTPMDGGQRWSAIQALCADMPLKEMQELTKQFGAMDFQGA